MEDVTERKRKVGLGHISEAIGDFMVQLEGAYGLSTNPDFWPPPESPIEDRFERCIWNYLAEEAELRRQVEVVTICGTFYLDFVVTVGDHRVAFECDGKEFHSPERDAVRDALILATGRLSALYRIPGTAIHRHIDDTLMLISRWEPGIFRRMALADLDFRATWFGRNNAWMSGSYAEIEYVEKRETGFDLHETLALARRRVGYRGDVVALARRSGVRRLDDLLLLLRDDTPADVDETGSF